MTTLAPATAADGTIQLATVKVRHWKMAISLGITTVLLFLLFLLVPRDGVSTFRLSDRSSSLNAGRSAERVTVTAPKTVSSATSPRPRQ